MKSLSPWLFIFFAILFHYFSTSSGIAINYSVPRSAQEGVKLLEHILQKMHNMPQIALSRGQSIIVSKPQLSVNAFGNSGTPKIIASSENGGVYTPPAIGGGAHEYEYRKSEPRISLHTESLARKQSETTQLKSTLPMLNEPSGSVVLDQKAQISNSPSPKYDTDAKMSNKSTSAGPSLSGAANGTIGPSLVPNATRSTTLFYAAPSQGFLSQRSQYESSSRGSLLHAKAALAPKEYQIIDSRIALSPPTVITGIPLIKLGDMQKEVDRALGKLGQIKKEPIESWSVWSLYKPKSTDCSVQIFMRQGTVEAIRIFDSSFLRPDMPIALGDGLSKVKEKFGEPAFIISDQAITTTQNYIYPINQIGFQFSKSKQAEMPKIISMIIFNVR